MKKAILVFVALVLLAGACDVDSGGGDRSGSRFGNSSGGSYRARMQRRAETRRELQRQQRRLALIERRREARIEARRRARIAALRRERREQARREQEQALAAAPEPAENCTEGYDPCLPPASDYDCEGGSGDGPAYTGYVSVTGYDPYDLDSDNDGAGCES